MSRQGALSERRRSSQAAVPRLRMELRNAHGTARDAERLGKAQKVKNYSPGHIEQAPSRGHEASPQSGLGVG